MRRGAVRHATKSAALKVDALSARADSCVVTVNSPSIYQQQGLCGRHPWSTAHSPRVGVHCTICNTNKDDSPKFDIIDLNSVAKRLPYKNKHASYKDVRGIRRQTAEPMCCDLATCTILVCSTSNISQEFEEVFGESRSGGWKSSPFSAFPTSPRRRHLSRRNAQASVVTS